MTIELIDELLSTDRVIDSHSERQQNSYFLGVGASGLVCSDIYFKSWAVSVKISFTIQIHIFNLLALAALQNKI